MILRSSKILYHSLAVQSTFFETTSDDSDGKKEAPDGEPNKKNRVIVAQFASKEAIANTPHSPRFNNNISQKEDPVNLF